MPGRRVGQRTLLLQVRGKRVAHVDVDDLTEEVHRQRRAFGAVARGVRPPRRGPPGLGQPGQHFLLQPGPLRRARRALGGPQVQRGAVGAERVRGRGAGRPAVAGEFHVTDVLAGQGREPVAVLGVAPDQVGGQVGAQVADVRAAGPSRAAAVHPQQAPPRGRDLGELPGLWVGEPEHPPSLWTRGRLGAEPRRRGSGQRGQALDGGRDPLVGGGQRHPDVLLPGRPVESHRARPGCRPRPAPRPRPSSPGPRGQPTGRDPPRSARRSSPPPPAPAGAAPAARAYLARWASACASSLSAATIAACSGPGHHQAGVLADLQQLGDQRRVAGHEAAPVARQVGPLGQRVHREQPLVRLRRTRRGAAPTPARASQASSM